MANQLTLGVGINAAALQAAINNVVNRTYTINGVQVNNRGIAQAQQALGRITGSASEFQKSMEAANARVVAFGASAGVIYVLKRAFDGLISSTIEVENSITEINSILNLSSRQISTFSSQLFSAANSVSVSFDDASKAATEFARQGLGVEQTLKRTRDSLILAKISGMDFADSATAITAALNSFSNELITSTDLVDRLTNADANFAVSSRDLAEAIKRVGSSASEANISLNETIALVTAAQQTTARGGSVIGNSFKTIFTRLSRGSVLDDLEAIGVKTRDASGNTLPLIQVLKNLSSTYDTLSSRQQSFVAEMVGGVYQINILKSTLRDLSSGASVFSQALSTLENSTGSAQARINQLNETISAKLIVTLNNLKEISSAIGSQTFAPILKGGLDVLNSQLETFKEFSGEGIGKRLADGILGGIKGALAGPGAFFAGFFATKLLGNFGGFVRDSISSFAGLNSAAQQQAQIQNQIVQYLQRNPALLGQIHSGATTVAQAHQQILAIIRQENALLAYQTQQAAVIASMAYRSGVRVAPAPAPGPARGYIPNFSSGFIPNFSAETSLAKSLGASAGVKEVAGKGTIGGRSFIANSEERQIPNFAGSGETAVIPNYGGGREKAAKMIAAGKSGPILASGFIPNFASSYLLKNLKQKIDLGIASQDDIKLYNEMSSSTPSGMSFSGEKTFSNKFGKAVLATTGAGGYDISSVNIPPKMRGQGGSYDLYDQMFKFLRESGVKKVGGVLLGQGKGASQFPFATLKRRLQFGKGTTVELLNGKTVTLKSMEDLIKFSKSVSPKDIRAGLDVSTMVANGFIPNFAPLGNVFDFDGTLGLVPKNPVKTPDGTVRKITHADTYHGWSASHMIPSPLVSRVRKRKEPITVLTARGQDSIPFIQEWLTKQNIPFEQVIGTGDSSRYPKDIADNTPRKKAYELNKMGASGKKFYEDSDINLRVAYRLAGIKRRLVDFGNEGIGQLANGFIPNFASMQLTQFKPTASERELQGGKVPFAAEEISSVRQFVERLRKKYPQMSGIRALMTGGRSQEKRIERGSNFAGIDSAVSGMLGGKKFAFMIQTKAGKPRNVKEKDLKFEEGLSDLQKSNPEFLKDVNEFVNVLSLSSRNKPEGFQKKLPMFGAGFVPNFAAALRSIKSLYGTKSGGNLKDLYDFGGKDKPIDKYDLRGAISRKSLPLTSAEYDHRANLIIEESIGNKSDVKTKEYNGVKIGEYLPQAFKPETLMTENSRSRRSNLSNIKGALAEIDTRLMLKNSGLNPARLGISKGIDFVAKTNNGLKLIETKATSRKVPDEVILAKALTFIGRGGNYKDNSKIADTIPLKNIEVFESKGLASGFIPNFNKLLNTPMGTAMRVKAGSLQTGSILAETVPQSSIKFSGDVEDFIKQIETSAGRKLTKGELRVLRYAPYFNKLNGLENPSALQRFLHSETKSGGFASLASGFIPNFAYKRKTRLGGGREFWLRSMGVDPNSVNRALNTERSAGKGAELRADPLIGPYVAQPGQPSDLKQLIKQDHPEGLYAAIQNSKKSQGLARGFIPNFAAESDTGITAIANVILGSVAALRANTEALRNQTRSQNVSNQIDRVTGPNARITGQAILNAGSLSNLDSIIRGLENLSRAGSNIRSTIGGGQIGRVQAGQLLPAAIEQREVLKSQRLQNISLASMAVGPGLSGIAGAMDPGQGKAAMENFSNSANLAAAAFSTFPGTLGAVGGGIILLGGAITSGIIALSGSAEASKLQAEKMKENVANLSAASQSFLKLREVQDSFIANSSAKATALLTAQQEYSDSLNKLPDAMRSEFQSAMLLANTKEEQAALLAKLNLKYKNQLSLREDVASRAEKGESGSNIFKNILSGNFSNPFQQNSKGMFFTTAAEKERTKLGLEASAASTLNLVDQEKLFKALNENPNMGAANVKDTLKALATNEEDKQVIENLFANLDDQGKQWLANSFLKRARQDKTQKDVEKETENQRKALARLKNAESLRVQMLREEASSLYQAAAAISTMGARLDALRKQAAVEAESQAFGSMAGAQKRTTGLQTAARIDAEVSRRQGAAKAISEFETKNASFISESLSKLREAPGQAAKDLTKQNPDQIAANDAIQKAMSQVDQSLMATDPKKYIDQLKAKAGEGKSDVVKKEISSKLENSGIRGELEKNAQELRNNLKINEKNAREQEKANLFLARIEQNSKAFGGIENFLDKSKAREDSREFRKSLRMAGSGSLDRAGRGSLKLIMAAQKDLGGALTQGQAGGLQEMAINARAAQIRREASKRIRQIQGSNLGFGQKQGLISAYQDVRGRSREIAKQQVEEAAKLEKAPLEQLKKLDELSQQFQNLTNVLTTSGAVIAEIKDPKFDPSNRAKDLTRAAQAKEDQSNRKDPELAAAIKSLEAAIQSKIASLTKANEKKEEPQKSEISGLGLSVAAAGALGIAAKLGSFLGGKLIPSAAGAGAAGAGAAGAGAAGAGAAGAGAAGAGAAGAAGVGMLGAGAAILGTAAIGAGIGYALEEKLGAGTGILNLLGIDAGAGEEESRGKLLDEKLQNLKKEKKEELQSPGSPSLTSSIENLSQAIAALQASIDQVKNDQAQQAAVQPIAQAVAPEGASGGTFTLNIVGPDGQGGSITISPDIEKIKQDLNALTSSVMTLEGKQAPAQQV